MRGWAAPLLAHSLFGLSAIWLVVWLGLATLCIALLVLSVTRWGQSQPLRKCAVLSLLAHLLLAYVATSVKLMSDVSGLPHGSASGSPHGSVVQLVLSSDIEISGDGGTTAATVDSLAPEPFAESAPLPENAPPVPAPLDPSVVPPQKIVPDPVSDPISAPPIPETNHAVVAPTAVAAVARPTSSEAAIEPADVPPPQRRDDPEAAPAATPATAQDVAALATAEQSLTAPATTVAQANATQLPSTTDTSEAVVSAAPPLRPIVRPSAARQTAPVATNHAPHEIPGIYQQRIAEGKQQALASRGGGIDTEAAVDVALRWLAANQSDDGRWDAVKHGGGRESRTLGHDRHGAGTNADTGVSGLALLAFLAAGHTHQRGDYQNTVRRGLEFLLNAQTADGNLSGQATLFARTYCHGMATLALSEACAMSGDERLLPAVRAAAAYTVAAQHAGSGGWRYSPGDFGDTSQHGWQVMALRSAELAGVPTPRETRTRAVRFLQSVATGEQGGLASYRPRQAASRAMTAEALFCRELLSEFPAPAATREAQAYLLTQLPGQGEFNLYYWYYATLALHQLQGEPWDEWNSALKPTLLNSQRRSGDLAGSWDANCVWGGYGGRVYTTSLACLCLEVYYRYLPVYVETARRVRP